MILVVIDIRTNEGRGHVFRLGNIPKHNKKDEVILVHHLYFDEFRTVMAECRPIVIMGVDGSCWPSVCNKPVQSQILFSGYPLKR